MGMSSVLFLLACLGAALAYPNGPPATSCKTMFPSGHKAESQTSDPPYTITVGANNYRNNVTVTLKALDGGYFEGVFIQARRAKCGDQEDEAVGSYRLEDPEASDRLKAMDCSGSQNALAHKDKDKKKELRFVWIPPPQDVGTIYFRGTFVKETEEFWTDVTSGYVADRQNTDDSPEKCLSAGHHASPMAFFVIVVCAALAIFISSPR